MIDTDEARWLLTKFNLDEDLDEDTPISNYYRWIILKDTSALKRSEDSGFLPAMEFSRNDAIVKLAADAGELHAIYRTHKDFNTLYLLAKKAYPFAISAIVATYSELLSQNEYPMFVGRLILLNGDKLTMCTFSNITQRFWFGREIGLYPQYWVEGHFPRRESMDCISIYETISNRARRSSLQVVAALKPFLGRDVATMIGKMVYKTRETECDIWSVDSI